MDDKLKIAKYWHDLGLNILGAYPNSKYLLPGSRILGDLLSFPELIKLFQNTDNNIQLVPNLANNGLHLIVLDFDDVVEYAKWINEFGLSTHEVSTKRGKHIYFWLRNQPLGSPINCEIKYRQAVTIPPSVVKRVRYNSNGKDILIRDSLDDCVRVATPASRVYNVEEKNRRKLSLSIRNSFSFPRCESSEARKVSFDAIKEAKPILDYLNETRDPDTRFLSVHCPVHQSDQVGRASLSVNTMLNLVKCNHPFCKLSGRWFDIIGLHAIIKGISNQEAAIDLAENYCI